MKKIIVSLLLLLPLGLIAQEVKIAFVDQNEIYMIMPEVDAMENATAAKQKEYEDILKSMQEEYNRKYSELTQRGDSLTENIRLFRVQEVEDLGNRIQNVYSMGQEEVNKTRESHMLPIQEKVLNAINVVGEENGYMCILLPQALLYRGKGIIDATAQVKTKLGLK